LVKEQNKNENLKLGILTQSAMEQNEDLVKTDGCEGASALLSGAGPAMRSC